MSKLSKEDKKVQRGKRLKKALALLVFGVFFWMVHPWILSWGVRKGIEWGLHQAGLRMVSGEVHARFFHPIRLTGLKIEGGGSLPTLTKVEADEVVFRTTSLFRIQRKRFFQEIQIKHLSGTLDFRTEALPKISLKKQTPEEDRKAADRIRMFLPENMVFQGDRIDILADGQSYAIKNIRMRFSESEADRATVDEIAMEVGSMHQKFSQISAVTAWKNGVIYLGDTTLNSDIRIEQFTVDFIRPGGPGLAFDLTVQNGSLRGDIDFDVKDSHPFIQAAFIAHRLPVKPIPQTLGMDLRADGKISEGRFTFSGDPGQPDDAEMSLRFHAEDIQWAQKGWDALTVGSIYSQRKLTIQEIILHQNKNNAQIKGELTIPREGADFLSSNYTLSLSAHIPELEKLVQLMGDIPLSGQMSVEGNLTGQGLVMDGSLKFEGSQLNYHGIDMDSALGEIAFKKGEAQIAKLEILSGKDRIDGKGSVWIAAPHAFNGEVQLSLTNIANYLSRLPINPLPQIEAGSLSFQWQGDGTPSAHSGAFHAKLDHVVTPWTPAGLTSEWEGTYSPENIDFRKLEVRRGKDRVSAQSTLSSSGMDLRNIQFFTGNKKLLSGACFLPVNMLKLFQGETLKQALDATGKIYAQIESSALELQEVGKLFGQQLPVDGRVGIHLEATGTAGMPMLNGKLTGQQIRSIQPGTPIPPSNLDLSLQVKEGVATADGKYVTLGFAPVVLKALVHLSKPDEGILGWINPSAPMEASAEFPKTDIGIFRPFLPKVQRLEGVLSGALRLTQTLSDPQLEGTVELHKGAFEAGLRTPPLTDLEAKIRFDTSTAHIENLRGAIGAGPFSIIGSAQFEGPELDLIFKGTKILLARDASMRLRANIDLRLHGKGEVGDISGEVRLVDGRLYQRLEILPLLIPSPVRNTEPDPLPEINGLVPSPFSKWALNIAIRNETPFLVAGNIAHGEIIPDLWLRGTAGQPLPEGTVTFKDMAAFLPFSTMYVKEGHIYFSPKQPLVPILDVRGIVEAQGFDITAYAYGPLSERNLLLRSDPPLSRESIILLLTTGIVPGGTMSGAGFGQAAMSQGGMLLMRALFRQFDLRGSYVDSLVNRVQVSVVPPDDPRDQPLLRSDFRLKNGFSLTAERDELNFYNAGISYSFRFR